MSNDHFVPRKFQAQNLKVAQSILAGTSSVRTVLNDITPGGGKSCIPPIYASVLIPSFAEKIAWFAPRMNLKQQGALAFDDLRLRTWLGCDMRIREECNDIDPSRGSQGYISTHQAVGANPDLHLHEFERFRYILVIDEPHHLYQGSDLARKFAPLVERAKLVILMTGTLGRHDKERVAFVQYDLGSSGREEPVTDSSADYAVIRYTRANALSERAIIPIEFTLSDFSGSWLTNGVTHVVQSFDEVDKENGTKAALVTALNTAFADELLDRCVRDWQGYRQDNPHAQLIIASHSQSAAQEHAKRVKRLGINCGVATVDEGEAAQHVIKKFRVGKLEAIATVGMAHEGMDAPSAVFIACLSGYRSRPFLEQLFARATRMDRLAGPWQNQRAYIYVPDDPWMRKVVQQIQDEQKPYLKLTCGPGGTGPQPSDVIPLTGTMSAQRSSELGGDSLDRHLTGHYQVIIDKHGKSGRLTPLDLHRMRDDLMADPIPHAASAGVTPLTIGEEEKAYRIRLQQRCLRLDKRLEVEFGTTNSAMIRHFKKSRERMTLQELRRAETWLASQETQER